MVIRQQELGGLNDTFRGQVLREGDPGYEDARRVQNGLIDRRPAVIARCTSAGDVASAVRFARTSGLEIAVRGGGHGVAGHAVCDGGLVIDLSLMKGLSVDPGTRIACAEPGLTWGEYNQVTQAHGLASTGGVVSTTGIAGLTLGGGLGWLMRRCGLAADNLIAAEVVTAEGELVRASDKENADLLWALRGGGGNFGIVSRFDFRLHPVGPAVVSGFVGHPLERARDALRFARQFAAETPDEVTIQCVFLTAPDGSPMLAVAVCHCGPLDKAEVDLRPLKQFGHPLLDTICRQTYGATNTAMDAAFPKGALNYWKSSFLTELSDGAIDELIGRFADCPSPMTMMPLEYLAGAVTRVSEQETAFPHRESGWNLFVLSQWSEPEASASNIAWAQDVFDSMSRFRAPRNYVNYLGDEQPRAVSAAYGPNYDRLVQVKRKYDPKNVFHLNQNITP